jgi:hypothetical protein
MAPTKLQGRVPGQKLVLRGRHRKSRNMWQLRLRLWLQLELKLELELELELHPAQPQLQPHPLHPLQLQWKTTPGQMQIKRLQKARRPTKRTPRCASSL